MILSVNWISISNARNMDVIAWNDNSVAVQSTDLLISVDQGDSESLVLLQGRLICDFRQQCS